MRFLGILFLLSCASLYGESIILVPPKDATEESIRGAIPAVLKRCEAYGYSGMTAGFLITKDTLMSAGGRGQAICLTSPAEISDQMRHNLVRLFAVAGKSADLCQVYAPTDVEKEQFKPGGAAPDKAAWVYVMGARTPDDKQAPPILVYSGRSLPRSEMSISIEQRTVEVKKAVLQKRKVEGRPILRIDDALIWYEYHQHADPAKQSAEQRSFPVYEVSEPIGANIADSGNVLRLTFHDRIVFTWVAVPLPFPYSVNMPPPGFLPPPALPKPKR